MNERLPEFKLLASSASFIVFYGIDPEIDLQVSIFDPPAVIMCT